MAVFGQATGQVNMVKAEASRWRGICRATRHSGNGRYDSNPTDDVKRIKVCRVETVCKMRYQEGHTPRTRVRNLVLPLRYEDENVSISDNFHQTGPAGARQFAGQARCNGAVHRLHRRRAPDRPRREHLRKCLSLSKAKANRVALAMQKILGLPASAIESEGRGASHPVASNETAQGRALNRRIEVEFWYDDPLQELSEEPQLCPDDVEETVTRIYDPPWGSIPNLALANGQPIIPAGYAADLHRALDGHRESDQRPTAVYRLYEERATRPPHCVCVRR